VFDDHRLEEAGPMFATRMRRQVVTPQDRFLTADWRNLLMVNFAVDPQVLEPLVPAGTVLDFFQGQTFVTIVGFQWRKTRLLNLPIPFHQDFPEVNLRFYIRRHAADGWRRGVVFIKEVVPRTAVAVVARWIYNEHFVRRPMTSHVRLPHFPDNRPGRVEYAWKHGRVTNRLSANLWGKPSPPCSATLDEFIAEHYWGYTVQRDGATLEYRVEHPPWQVWRTSEVEYTGDAAAFYGSRYAKTFAAKPVSTFVADGSPVNVYRAHRLEG
jgi:hypothetical protein